MSRRSIIGGVGRDQTHTLIEKVRPDTEIIIEVIIIIQTEIMPVSYTHLDVYKRQR